jgi:hypothetical protein
MTHLRSICDTKSYLRQSLDTKYNVLLKELFKTYAIPKERQFTAEYFELCSLGSLIGNI